MMKRMLSLLLCLAMLLSLAPTHVFAAEDGTEPSEETTVPTQSETEPVEETTAPTQAETEPMQETTAAKENENQAADEVAALIEALPALEAIQAKPMEEQQADYNQVQAAYSAYEALTEEQKALLPSVEEIFGAYFDYFNGLTAPAYGIEEEEGTCGDDLTWKVDTTGTLTISGTGPMTDFADSESLPWQNNVLNIKTIVMDDTITTIGDYAFAGFWNLESVTLPQNLTKIGDYAFDSAGCSADSVSIDITIPSTLTQMGDYAFRNAKGLKQVVFENGITSIGYASFNNCTALTELVIPASVTQIADYAFETCTNVASITFMGNAPSFGQVIFRNITANVYYPVNNSTWTSDIMQNYGGTLSWLGTDLCAQGHNYIDNVCSACGMITGTAASGSVRWTLDSEGKLSVYKTGDMSDYNINNSDLGTYYTSVTSIHYEEGAEIICVPCISSPILTSIVFPDTTKTIYFRSVSYLPESLTELTIPASVTSIHTEEPYYGPDNYLIRVNVDEDNEVYTSVDGVVYSADMTKLVYYPRCHSAESYTVPETVNSLEHGFINCDNLSVIQFTGNAPTMEEFFNGILAFNCTEATIIYPAGDTTWDSLIGKNFAGKLKWQDSEGNLLTSGSFSTNITWSFDQKETLTISGTGAMQDLSDFMCSGEGRNIAPDVPWLGFVSQIKTVIFEGAITNIGSYTFGNSTKYNYDIQDVFFQGTEEEFTAALKDENSVLIAENVTLHCIEATGTCGENVTWILEHGGYLTVSGTGAMYDYASDTEQPWGAYQDSIQSAVIEDGVTSIGAYAFANCAALTSVTMTDSVETIGSHAFYDCTTLSSIDLSDSLTELSNSVFGYCKALESIVVPNQVTVIGENAFNATENLTQITLGRSVTTINGWAFQSSGISEIVIPKAVTTISNYAFMNCSKLAAITFEGGAPSLGTNAFYNVTVSASYPVDHTTWTEAVLQNYGGNITWTPYGSTVASPASGVCGENVKWSLDGEGTLTISGSGAMYDYSSNGAPWYVIRDSVHAVVVEAGVTTIGSNAFNCCEEITAVTLPTGLTSIGDYAFNMCRSMRSINIPNTVISIGESGFMLCMELPSITLPEGITEIKAHTFDQCCMITSNIIIPASVQQIGSYAFWHCTTPEIWFTGDAPTFASDALKSTHCTYMYYPANNTSWTNEVLSQYYGGSFTWKASDDVSVDPETPTPEATTAEASGSWGSNLTWTLDKTGTLTLSGSGEMQSFVNVEYDGLGWTVYPWYQYNTAIKHLVLEEGITSLALHAFRDCNFLESASLPESLTSMNMSFFNCIGLTEIEIPANATILGTHDFQGCTSLKRAIIRSKSGSIPYGMFYGCSALEEVYITEGPTFIGRSAFESCTSLKSLTIPATITEIDKFALTSCNSLTSVIFAGNAPVFNLTAFYGASFVAYYPADNTTWTEDVMQNYGGTITWIPYVENRAVVSAADLANQTSVFVDGVEYPVQTDGDNAYVDLPDSNAKTMVAYTYASDDSGDAQTQYPTGMTVWMLTNNSGIYTATRVEELDNILQYSGMSIRVTGNKGIRMITSIEQTKKDSLTADGLAGYTLKEYGTVVAWASKLESGEPLTLGQSYTVSNYAYKKGIADPVFAYDGDLMQYTNVLVNFSDEQCKNDLALRPYMILEDAEGNEITLYGGIVTRSIGYIAYQNRDTFTAGTEAYEYIWDIIHSVYGDAYDEAYIA